MIVESKSGLCLKKGSGVGKLLSALVTVVALSVSPAFADETLPLSTMTCKSFVDSPRDTIGIILTWLMGHLHDEDTPAEINFTKMEDLGKKLGTYCGKNPTHALMKAVEKITE
jgi:acid stress chaperone HdeB